MLPKHQKGFIQLGLFGVLLLVGALAVGTKVVSDPNFIFDIASRAKAPEGKEACQNAGCPWKWKNGECKKTEKSCVGESKSEAKLTCKGGGKTCVNKSAGCSGNLVNSTGSCGKGQVCCGPKVPEKKDDSECTTGKTQDVACKGQSNGKACDGTRTQKCVDKKWKNVDEACKCEAGSSGGGGAKSCGDTPHEKTKVVDCKTAQGCEGKLTQKCTNGGWGPESECKDSNPNDDCPKVKAKSDKTEWAECDGSWLREYKKDASGKTQDVRGRKCEFGCKNGSCLNPEQKNETAFCLGNFLLRPGAGKDETCTFGCKKGACLPKPDDSKLVTNCSGNRLRTGYNVFGGFKEASSTRCAYGCKNNACVKPTEVKRGVLCGPWWRTEGYYDDKGKFTITNMDFCASGCNKDNGKCNPLTPKKAPGAACIKDDECKSGNCLNNLQEGIPITYKCQ